MSVWIVIYGSKIYFFFRILSLKLQECINYKNPLHCTLNKKEKFLLAIKINIFKYSAHVHYS